MSRAREDIPSLLIQRKEEVRRLAIHLVRTFIFVNLACVFIIGFTVESFPREADELGPFMVLTWFGVNLFMLGWARKRSAPALSLKRIDSTLARKTEAEEKAQALAMAEEAQAQARAQQADQAKKARAGSESPKSSESPKYPESPKSPEAPKDPTV